MRKMIVSDIQAFALAPSTRNTFTSIANEIWSIATQLSLHPWDHQCLKAYFQSLLDKGWKLSSVLCRVRNTAMLTSRYSNLELTTQAWFRDFSQGLQRLSALEAPKQAVPITLTQLHQLLSALIGQKNWQLAAFFALAWLTAARIGDIIKLPRCNIRHLESPMTLKLSLAKGVFGPQEKVLQEGPLSDIVRRYLHESHQATRHATRLFTCTRQQVTSALRRTDKTLSGHSLRRGALQHADRKGVRSEDLQVLSGHKSTTILQRYIGRASSSRRKAMERTGHALQHL